MECMINTKYTVYVLNQTKIYHTTSMLTAWLYGGTILNDKFTIYNVD